MLMATPGHGRVTRVTLHTRDGKHGHPAVEPRLLPRLNEVDPDHADGSLVPVVTAVDVVLPHGQAWDATGLSLRFLDADAARAFGRAAYRAAALLGTTVPDTALSAVESIVDEPLDAMTDTAVVAV